MKWLKEFKLIPTILKNLVGVLEKIRETISEKGTFLDTPADLPTEDSEPLIEAHYSLFKIFTIWTGKTAKYSATIENNVEKTVNITKTLQLHDFVKEKEIVYERYDPETNTLKPKNKYTLYYSEKDDYASAILIGFKFEKGKIIISDLVSNMSGAGVLPLVQSLVTKEELQESE